MMIEKIQPETLLQLLLEVLKNTPQFKYISGNQPFLMSFRQQKYYVYVKNLSSAYFKERPDTTRAQLPIRDEFENIKLSPYPFIFLGYDQINDVLVCWNYHIAKSRLNEKKSVSFYSRTFFQEEVVAGEFLRKQLKNGDIPVLFKRKDLAAFFEQISTFFLNNKITQPDNVQPNQDEQIQLPTNQNRKITEIDDKDLLKQLKPLLAINSPHTLEAIKVAQAFYGDCPAMKFRDWAKLIKSVNFENPNDIESSIAEDKSLKLFIEPNIDSRNISHEKAFIQYLRDHLSDNSINHYISALSGRISKGIRQYLDPNITSVFLLSDATKISNFAEKLFQISEFIELDRTGKKMYSCAIKKYIQFVQFQSKQQNADLCYLHNDQNSKKKTNILRVTYPNGRVIEDKVVVNTLLDVIDYAGAENVHNLGIMINGTNLLSDVLPDIYSKTKQYFVGRYVVMTCSNTDTKFRQIKQISDILGLNLKVEKVSLK
jgi:hypothetical protein